MEKQLFEELSISDEIKTEAENLAKVILADSKLNADSIKKYGFDNVLKNEFKLELFGEIYTIQYYIYNINNSKDFNNHLFKILQAITRNNEKEIELSLLTINDLPNNEYFLAPIWHELTHVYQYIKSKKDVLDNKNINTLYLIANNVRENGVEAQKLFANAIYASFDFEQDALIHETYGEFMRKTNIYTIETTITFTNTYEYIRDLEKAIDQIDNLDENLFKNTKEFYLNLFTKKLKRFKNKFGKLIVKLKKKFYENNLNEGLLPTFFRNYIEALKDINIEIKSYIDDEVF